MSTKMSTKLKFSRNYHLDNVCEPVIPSRAYPSDIGLDLTLVRHVKDLNEKTAMYDSSISVLVPDGFYVEIVPRSSLSKYGYIMANSVGIIDPSYRGTLRVVLTKVVDSAEPLTLPLTRFQLIIRKIHQFDVEVIDTDASSENTTDRGSGGFGSTD